SNTNNQSAEDIGGDDNSETDIEIDAEDSFLVLVLIEELELMLAGL
ncbi:MAG: hypothetical protein H0W23_04670, partial [Chloroflexia bacterium]|nr:hypothetical protein [Chloroflexia bacterium]